MSQPTQIRPGVFRSGESTRGRAHTLLTALGNHPDQVAQSLLAAGCLGEPLCSSCPIAVYLLKSDLAPRSVNVNDLTVCLYWDDGMEEIDLPEPVSRFVPRFDAGKY